MRTESLDTSRIKVTKPAGAHPEKRLTAIGVRNMKPGRYADGNGLYLRVDPSGSRRWMLRTIIAGRRCDMGLGSVQLVPLAEARAEAMRLRKIARAGGDPLAERREKRGKVLTFKEAAKQVHAAHSATFRNPKHREQWLSSLEADVFPTIGNRRVDTITSADVLKVLGEIWLVKPESARRVLQRMKVIFEWCRAQGYCAGDKPIRISSAHSSRETNSTASAGLSRSRCSGLTVKIVSSGMAALVEGGQTPKYVRALRV